jgi:hypothetical protein
MCDGGMGYQVEPAVSQTLSSTMAQQDCCTVASTSLFCSAALFITVLHTSDNGLNQSIQTIPELLGLLEDFLFFCLFCCLFCALLWSLCCVVSTLVVCSVCYVLNALLCAVLECYCALCVVMCAMMQCSDVPRVVCEQHQA